MFSITISGNDHRIVAKIRISIELVELDKIIPVVIKIIEGMTNAGDVLNFNLLTITGPIATTVRVLISIIKLPNSRPFSKRISRFRGIKYACSPNKDRSDISSKINVGFLNMAAAIKLPFVLPSADVSLLLFFLKMVAKANKIVELIIKSM